MSYESEILSDTPVLYYRLNQLGFGTDGESVPDLSGSNRHATLAFTGSQAAWGHPSPIETDASSKEFWGYTNANIAPWLFTGHSRIGKSTESAIEPTGDFTVEGWLRPMENIPLAGTFLMFGKSGSCGVMLTASTGTRIGGFVIDSADNLFTVIDTSFLVTDNLGTSFYVRVERLGNALALYVNRTLRATTTITSGLPTKVSTNDFAIHANSSFGLVIRYDEVAFYDYALGNVRGVVHYESALNVLNSSATITVRVPVSLDTDSVEPIDFPFTHNWADPLSGQERVITEHLSWKTHSNRSEPDYHQRIGARSHGPLRQLEYAITPTTARARTALQRTLWQPAQFYRLPIATDWVELTAQANVSDAILNCNTTLRDFEIGGYVTLWGDVYDPSTARTFRITSVSDTQLGVTPVVASIYPVGSQLMPARLACLPDEESQFDSYTIDLETGALRFEILSTELSTRRVTTYVPASTHESIEVFSLDGARFDILEQAQYQIQRRQSGTGLLTGNDYYRMVNTIAPVTIPVRVLLVSRETLSEFYGWLEARQGRRNPVWVVSADNDLEFVSIVSPGGLTTTFKTRGYSTYNLHYGRRHIQLVYSDGSVVNRKITALVDNGDGTETLTVATLPAGTITKISFLRLCVAPDSFELRFHRDLTVMGGTVVECTWEFTELLTTP